jgi:hypothetical protein
LGRTVGRTTIALAASVVLALVVSACGSSSSSSSSAPVAPTDPVSTALQTPGIRTVLLAKQRGDLTIVVPPCPEQGKPAQAGAQPNGGIGDTSNSANAPAGSSRIVIPRGTLTQTVAVQPCPPPPPSSGGGSSGPTGASSGGQAVSTILMTPGGTTPQTQQQTQSQQNQLVVPENSSITTLVVPPCTTAMPSGATGASGATGPTGTQGQVLPANSKSVTAPACTIPQQQQSGGG